jgi:hypothetical protein
MTTGKHDPTSRRSGEPGARRTAADVAGAAPAVEAAGWYGLPRPDRSDVAWALGLTAVVVLAWCTAFAKWTGADWQTPTADLEPEQGDMLHLLAMMKSAGRGEFIPLAWKQPSQLGAPGTANWNDWPLVEEFQVLWFALLGRVFGLFAGLNLGVLSCHVAAALSMFAVARGSGCARPWAFVAGLAFGLAPYLFAQSPHHLTCLFTWHLPLVLLVWRWVCTAPGIVPGTPRFRQALAIGAVTGLQSPYFTNILCQVTLLGAGIMLWRGGTRRAFAGAMGVIAAAAVAFAVMNADTWSYRIAHGPNPGVLVREYKWMELYGLKLVDLVMPLPSHHSRSLATLATAHRVGDLARGVPPASPLQDEGSYLGIVGICALAWLSFAGVKALVGGRADDVPSECWQVLWVVLCFSTGGFNAILGAAGVTLFRAACRYSVVILAIVLLWAARRLSQSAASSSGPAALAAAALLALVVLWDQVPRTPGTERRALITRQVEGDRDYVRRMEAALPEGAMVFQLPIMAFPEAPAVGVPPYDHFRPYLYGDRLRYSFGSMKGRDTWQEDLGRLPFEQAVAELKQRGFAAIAINRNGFPDRARGLEEKLVEMGYDAPPIRNATGELTCVLLTPAAGAADAPPAN